MLSYWSSQKLNSTDVFSTPAERDILAAALFPKYQSLSRLHTRRGHILLLKMNFQYGTLSKQPALLQHAVLCVTVVRLFGCFPMIYLLPIYITHSHCNCSCSVFCQSSWYLQATILRYSIEPAGSKSDHYPEAFRLTSAAFFQIYIVLMQIAVDFFCMLELWRYSGSLTLWEEQYEQSCCYPLRQDPRARCWVRHLDVLTGPNSLPLNEKL